MNYKIPRPIILFSLFLFIIGIVLSYFISININNLGQDKNRSIYETESSNVISKIKDLFLRELDSSSSVSVAVGEISSVNKTVPLSSFLKIGEEFFQRSLTERTVLLKRVKQKDIIYTEDTLSKIYNHNVTIRFVFSKDTLEDTQDLWIAYNTFPTNLFIVGLDLYHEPTRRGLIDNMLKNRISGALNIDKLFTGKNGLLTIKPIIWKNNTQIDFAVMDVFTYDRLFGELLNRFSLLYPKNDKCIFINNKLVYSIGNCKNDLGISTNSSIYDPSDIQIITSPYVYEKTILYYVCFILIISITTILCLFICFLDIKRYQAIKNSDIKTIFISEISHEIRTPMNGILGVTELLLDDNNLDKNTVTQLNTIKSCANTLLSIVNDILDISKIETGIMEINMVHCHIANIVNLCLKDLWNTFKVNTSKDIKLTFSSTSPSIILCDELRVKQILINLVTNSFKFTEKGSIDVKMWIEKTDKNNLLSCSVSDTGIGMSSKKIDDIFNPFTQINRSENSGGTGLGLTICKKLCTLMGGQISCKSTLGKGSEFTFFIPINNSSDDSVILSYEYSYNLSKNSNSSSDSINSIRNSPSRSTNIGLVLVVDDVHTNRVILKKILENIGLDVDTCNDGVDSISMCDLNKYSLIFMDVLMPKMNGTDATKKIRKSSFKNKTTPIIFVTADSSPGIDYRCNSSGGTGLLKKPISKKQILDIVYRYIPSP